MSKAEEDFEQVLTRCREQLTDISLTVPDLDEEGGELVPRFSLTESPPAVDARSNAEALVASSEPTLPPASVPRTTEVANTAAELSPKSLIDLPYFEPPPPQAPPPAAIADAAAPRHQTQPLKSPTSTTNKKPALLLGVLIAFVAAGLGAYRLARDTGGSRRVALDGQATSFLMPADSGNFFVSVGNELITVERTGEMKRRRAVEGPFAAMRWNQGALWSIDGKTATVAERRGDSRPTVYSLNHVPTSLFLNDRFLWTGERSSRTLRQFMLSRSILGAMLQPIDRIDLPSGVDLMTFAFEPNGDLYVIDANQHRIVRLRISGGVYRPSSSAPLSPILGPDPALHRLFLERGTIWSLSNPNSGSAELKRIPFSSLNWAPAE